MENFECMLPSWERMVMACKKVSNSIKEDGFSPDIVIALSRGGFVPARMICDFLIIKDLVSIKVDHWGITAAKDGKASIRYPIDVSLDGKNVLIVDDITDTGDSMKVAMDFVRNLKPKKVRTATAMHIKTSKFVPNYFGEEIDWKWVIFPWNYVEDMCNIVPKVFDGRSKSIEEIRSDLSSKFKIQVPLESILEILSRLKEKNAVINNPNGWNLVKP
jgi:uncharacterized protein